MSTLNSIMPYQDSWLIIMSTSKAMTQHGTQWLSHTNNYVRPWLITTNSSSHQSNYSSILFITAHRQLFKNTVQKDNNSRTVQGSLLFSTVSLLTWFQFKLTRSSNNSRSIVGRSNQYKIQSLPPTYTHLIPCCIL